MIFCPLENIQLDVNKCPIRKCIYRDSTGGCRHQELTNTNQDSTISSAVTAEKITEIKQLKLYKVKEESQVGKHDLSVGLIIDRYSEFVVTSFPGSATQPVNMGEELVEEQLVTSTLRKLFNLTPHQQLIFWSKHRFEDFCKRQKVEDPEISLSEVYRVLKKITPPRPKSTLA